MPYVAVTRVSRFHGTESAPFALPATVAFSSADTATDTATATAITTSYVVLLVLPPRRRRLLLLLLPLLLLLLALTTHDTVQLVRIPRGFDTDVIEVPRVPIPPIQE